MKKLIGITTALTLTATLAACGGESATQGEKGGEGGDTTVRVGTIPNPSVVAVYLGKEQKFFDGITVEPKHATGFAPNLAAVVNGESQVGFAAVAPLLVAKSKGAPIRIIAGTDAAPEEYDAATDPDNVVTMPDSGIKKPSDLEGKTVAVTALGSIQDLGVRIMVSEDGGDPDKVKFLVLPSNDMISALEAGRVDAVALSEPFNSAAKAKGLPAIFSYVTSPTPGAPVGAFFTSEATLKSSEDSINSFVEGVEKATEYANDNPEAVRESLLTYTKIPADVAKKVNTFPYSTQISHEQIDALSERLVEYGYMDKPVSAKDILR